MTSPIKVALAHVDHPAHTTARRVGFWAYDVPEFVIEHVSIPRQFELDRGLPPFSRADFVVHEDSRTLGEWAGQGPPVIYTVGDSTLDAEHYQDRRDQAKQADLVLVDWDSLARFIQSGCPVRRWPYCVNEHLYRPSEEKTIDVSFVCNPTPERIDLQAALTDFCESRGYSLITGKRAGDAYVESMGAARITINLARNWQTRSHRIYDAMACRSAVLTSPHYPVSEERLQAGFHYLIWRDHAELFWLIDELLQDNRWQDYAEAGYREIMARHTWAHRARDLRAILLEVFPERFEVMHVPV